METNKNIKKSTTTKFKEAEKQYKKKLRIEKKIRRQNKKQIETYLVKKMKDTFS